MRTRQARLLIITALILALAVSGCATWKQNVAVGYEATGITLKEVRDAARYMCDTGVIKPGDCAQIKDIYTKARSAYILSGDMLVLAIRAEDPIKQKEYMDLYRIAVQDVSKLLPQLIKLATDLGIKIGG